MRFKTKEKPKLRIPASDSKLKVDRVSQLLLNAPTKGKKATPVIAPIAVDKDTQLAIQSRFGKQSDTIVDLIEMGNSDGATSLIIKSLLQSLVEILPTAEKNVIATGATKGMYAFNTLISSTRELVGDLQAIKDRSNLGQATVDRCVRPSYMEIGVQIVTAFTLIQDSGKARMTPEDFREFRATLESVKKGLGEYIMAQYRDVSEQVVKSLG